VEKKTNNELVQACIFKVGDDVRQDALALQIIQWCQDIFSAVSLPHFLYPYRVLPNRTGDDNLIGGVIECVPRAQTRDEIGKSFGGSLKQYFLSKYGREEGAY
jgi:phosphatidylinositol 4-kinase